MISKDISNDYNILQSRVNTNLYTWTSIYALTIATFAVIDEGIENEVLIPGIGPILVLDYADEDYHGALIASSAIMVAPYANEEVKKSQIAKDVTTLGATMRDDFQSTRLKEQANEGVLDANPDQPSITKQSWFMPAMFAGFAIFGLMLVRR